MMKRQIHTGNHDKPKQRPFGQYGEHAHDYEWVEGEKKPVRSSRELSDEERVEHMGCFESPQRREAINNDQIGTAGRRVNP